MHFKKDYTGLKVGRLTMIRPLRPSGNGIIWECKCDCGATIERLGGAVAFGKVKSCGCLAKDTARELIKKLGGNKTHGGSDSRIYAVWSHMKSRCEYKKDKRFMNYGGRGIKVCDEWKNFESFRDWAYSSGYDENAKYGECTLDRIDTNGDYTPENCRWVNETIQANNRTTNRIIEYKGEKHTTAEWSRITGLPLGTIWSRWKRGLSAEKILYQGDLRYVR